MPNQLTAVTSATRACPARCTDSCTCCWQGACAPAGPTNGWRARPSKLHVMRSSQHDSLQHVSQPLFDQLVPSVPVTLFPFCRCANTMSFSKKTGKGPAKSVSVRGMSPASGDWQVSVVSASGACEPFQISKATVPVAAC